MKEVILMTATARLDAAREGGGGGGGDISEQALLQARQSDSLEQQPLEPPPLTTPSPEALSWLRKHHVKGTTSGDSGRFSGLFQRFKSPHPSNKPLRLAHQSKAALRLRRKLLDGRPGLPPPCADPADRAGDCVGLGSALLWPRVREDEPLTVLRQCRAQSGVLF